MILDTTVWQMAYSKNIKEKSEFLGWAKNNQIPESLRAEKIEQASEDQIKRNINCRHYINCLDKAAKANDRELECEKCMFRHDNSYKMDNADYSGLLKLYHRILSNGDKIV